MHRRLCALSLALLVGAAPQALTCQLACRTSASAETASVAQHEHATHHPVRPPTHEVVQTESHRCDHDDELLSLAPPAPHVKGIPAILSTVVVVVVPRRVDSSPVEVFEQGPPGSIFRLPPLRI